MRLQKLGEGKWFRNVSIHAPRVGCDAQPRIDGRCLWFQFTHPVWGATIDGADGIYLLTQFQFTHPVWGATASRVAWVSGIARFNSRTPCGVRPIACHSLTVSSQVSIHAPRVGCDSKSCSVGIRYCPFQFTHPVWGATDSLPLAHCELASFNSRTPCGVRQQVV